MAVERSREGAQNEGLSRFAETPARPVIIGGCPRSGTTLLRTMLHAHPEHAIPPRETRFVLESWTRRTLFGDLRDANNRRRLARWIFLNKKTHANRLGLKSEEAMKRLVKGPPTLGSLLAECFVMFAEKLGFPRWGDKRPQYALRIEAVFELFPQAQFIHVVRDPRACVASLRKLNWYGRNIVPSLEYWEASLMAVEAARSQLAVDQLLEVRYEELVLEPEKTLQRVTRFLGSASDQTTLGQMMRYHELDEKRRGRYHVNLKRPLDPSRVSGWRESLSANEIAFIEEATGPLMKRWEYEGCAADTLAPTTLLSEMQMRRRRRAVTKTCFVWLNRLQTHVTCRHPLAAHARGPVRSAEPAQS
jgi:hypothetical protein